MSGVEVDPGSFLRIGDRVYRGYQVIGDADQIARIRNGYVCVMCLEPHEEAFPEKCSAFWCGFPMRTHQAEVFAKVYEGEVRLGSSQSQADELDEMDERRARSRRARSGIWVPRAP